MKEKFPETAGQAFDMLVRAYWHLRNRDVFGTIDARRIINDLERKVLGPEEMTIPEVEELLK